MSASHDECRTSQSRKRTRSRLHGAPDVEKSSELRAARRLVTALVPTRRRSSLASHPTRRRASTRHHSGTFPPAVRPRRGLAGRAAVFPDESAMPSRRNSDSVVRRLLRGRPLGSRALGGGTTRAPRAWLEPAFARGGLPAPARVGPRPRLPPHRRESHPGNPPLSPLRLRAASAQRGRGTPLAGDSGPARTPHMILVARRRARTTMPP